MIDHEQWMAQPLIWGERCRGRSLAWTPDANWFINDPLGPMPHSHPDATEIAYLAQGNMEIEIGGSKRVYQAGDLIIMPPDKFHNYWFHGDETVCLFVLVTPNHKTARWQTSGWPAEAYQGDAPYGNVFAGGPIPSNEHFSNEVITLAPGQTEGPQVMELQDRIIYVLRGTATLTCGQLSGALSPNQYQYIPATMHHEIRNNGYEPVMMLSVVATDPFTAHGTELPVDEG